MKHPRLRRTLFALALGAATAALSGCAYWELGFGDWDDCDWGHGRHDYNWGGHHGGGHHGGGGGHCR